LDLLNKTRSEEELVSKLEDKYKEFLCTSEASTFWYVLSDLLFKYGRLNEDIKHTALTFIKNNNGVEMYVGKEDERRKVLNRLKTKIEGPQPKRKIIREKNHL